MSEQWRQDALAIRTEIAILKECDLLDEAGYPTEAALDIVSKWHWSDCAGWFAFIETIWEYRDWGWRVDREVTPVEYMISTGGWSGNESIIGAMEANVILWSFTWVQSRRGGHYLFEGREFESSEGIDYGNELP